MRILTVSDIVVNSLYNSGVKERFGDVDAVLSCGDLPSYYLEFLVSMLDVPLFFVHGNHAEEARLSSETPRRPSNPIWGAPPRVADDGSDAREPAGPCGCTNLDGKAVNYKGLLIAGLQGSKWYNGGPYQYTEDQMSRKILLLQPQLLLNRLRYGRALDILITHAPAAGIHDDVDQAHQGFRAFLKFMDDFAPRYLIHGHKHVYTHGEVTVTQYNRTTVINSYGFRRLELEVVEQ